ncbi:hypothetical protein SKAU_G00006630 [Synaphobranchus kaupii]|uniref:Uncharacterized protein n=1 Tax=Synaphobranchus kaupii TaxID=118154 RepID=A0A9Q1GA92_SYNKA|nr:hypothetical protein SKAU_G00006630 [Synaphobranchus kaupii]
MLTGGLLGPVKSTGVNSDTAEACGIASTTITRSARPPAANSGRMTTMPAVNGTKARAPRLRSYYSRVRERGWQDRPSLLPCGNSDRSLQQTGTCLSPRTSPRSPESLHSCTSLCLTTGFMYLYSLSRQPKWPRTLVNGTPLI